MKPVFLFIASALVLTGCTKLGEGVVRDIAFPEHEARIAPNFMARPVADSLVARAHTSVGILDSLSGSKIEDAMFSLVHESGESITWGGQADWVQGRGHVLTDVQLADGSWTLTVEAPDFESVTAEQVMPPHIDSIGAYAFSYTAELEDEVSDEIEGYAILSKTIDFTLTLPDRPTDSDYFLVRALKLSKLQEEEEEEEEEGEEVESGSYTLLNPSVEDDPRLVWNGTCGGYMIESLAGVSALTDLPFQIIHEAWGPELDALTDNPIVLEICALSPEMALYYKRLDLIENPSGGPLFTEPILAYSNVSSGYGCFGLYTSCALSIALE